MYTINESCICEVGRDPKVGKGAGQSLVPGSVGECCTRAVEKQAMNESEAPSNRQAGARVFNRPDLLAWKEAVRVYARVSLQFALFVYLAWREFC